MATPFPPIPPNLFRFPFVRRKTWKNQFKVKYIKIPLPCLNSPLFCSLFGRLSSEHFVQGIAPKKILESNGDGYVDSGRKRRDAKDLTRREEGSLRGISFLCTTVAQKATTGGRSRERDIDQGR